MTLKVGDKVRVLDAECTYSIKVGDVGTVVEPIHNYIRVYFTKYKVHQNFEEYQLQPVDEVIRVDCHKPNIFKRVCMYLRGKI